MEFLSDAIGRLAATPHKAAELVHGLTEAQLSSKVNADFFSLRENILHLRDIDVEGYENRVRLILTELCPVFPDVDGAKLAIERDYNKQPIGPALEDLRNSREASIKRLQACTESDLSRRADMDGMGTVDLRRLLELWMEHDAGHLNDMAELRAAIESGGDPAFAEHQVA